MTNLYWLYDLPNWLFGLITISAFVAFGLLGLFTTRKFVRRLHRVDHSHNDIVGFFLAGITVFYGITLGLVAVGTWDTYAAVEDKVDAEAQVIAAIYKDVGNYGEPWKGELRQDLRDYTRNVIDVSWPQQHKGIVPTGSALYLDRFQKHLMSFEPKTIAQQINQTEVFKQYNVLIEYRRARLNSVQSGLPGSIWCLVIIGALISIVVTLFFDTASLAMHFWMTVLLSGLLGLMIFLVGTLDNPFQGEVSISAEPLEMVYQTVMTPDAEPDHAKK